MSNETLTAQPLRRGYTTGACATAATRAALETLLTGIAPTGVQIRLPIDKLVMFNIRVVEVAPERVTCAVTKDAGDDPDITHGLEILSTVRLNPHRRIGDVQFLQGMGVGKITIHGHELQKGEPAINPVPRQMIKTHVLELLNEHGIHCGVEITLSVPEGEKIAWRTLNPRLGIEGGISILGTSGIVVPYSQEAYLASIHQSIRIATANGCHTLVFNSGSKSEGFLKQTLPHLPELCFIQYGNWIGQALRYAAESPKCKKIVAGVMLAKATKLAAGHLETSSRQVSVDQSFIADLAQQAGYSKEILKQIKELKLVRGVTDLIPFHETEPFYRLLAQTCYKVCRRITGNKPLTFYLMTLSGARIQYPES